MKIKAQAHEMKNYKVINLHVLGRVIPVRRVKPEGRVIVHGLAAQEVSRRCAFLRSRLDHQERKVELYSSKDSV